MCIRCTGKQHVQVGILVPDETQAEETREVKATKITEKKKEEKHASSFVSTYEVLPGIFSMFQH